MATALGCSVGVGYAASSIAPYGDVTRTTSPAAMPSAFAVSVAISTHASQATEVTGSGASCSHAREAPRPSYIRSDGYGSSAYPPASPSSFAGATVTACALAPPTAAAGTSRHTPPWRCAVARSPLTRGSHACLRYGSKLAQGSGPLPSSVPRTVRDRKSTRL